MNLELVKSIADAVLYEGYILYPYRASAVKNEQRFNFGVVVPDGYAKTQRGSDACTMQTECLVEGDRPVIDVHVRFLHLVSRKVFQLHSSTNDGTDQPTERYQHVPSLEVGDKLYQTWQEAVEREVVGSDLSSDELLAEPRRIAFAFGGGDRLGDVNNSTETLYDANERPVGKLTREQHLVQGMVTVTTRSLCSQLWVVSVKIENPTPMAAGAGTRDDALMHSLVSAHTLLGVEGGHFVSLLDPPQSFAEQAAACTNIGTWPVLAGEVGERTMMLSSPIILYDYPQIAPESGGEFFDGTEIDEMLALRVMTLTDDEMREMESVDPRARQVLERTRSLPTEQWQKMHGAIRGLRRVAPRSDRLGEA